ncbi:MAG: hypothetical protein ACRD9W_20600, partial [Terriglobia bacterium]
LATGLVFRVWANLIVAPVVAFGSALALASDGFGFLAGVVAIVACLFVSQLAYLVGVVLASPAGVADYLVEDVPDNQPGEDREHRVAGEQEQERAEHSPRPPPLES